MGKSFTAQTAIPEVHLTKIALLHLGRFFVLFVQEVVLLREAVASMIIHRMFLARAVGLLLEEAILMHDPSRRMIGRTSLQQLRSQEQSVVVDLDLEDLAVSLQDARSRKHLELWRKISHP